MSKLFHKLGDKVDKSKDKLQDKIDHIQAGVSRLGTAAATTWNPNHRHDEAHEKEMDAKRQAVLDTHRYQSFAEARTDNDAKWFIDGHDYFWALSEILEAAVSTIWICDWWLSPELYLRRPPAQNEQYRLDRILQRAAERGVRVFVQVYKEVTASMTMESKYTKHALEELHENISVMRHPDHSGGELVYFWSHHEKIVIVDNAIACIGGLDICYGRWDTHNGPLADVDPGNMLDLVFPGQDFNDARVADFEHVSAWTGNQQARTQLGRMPWQDVHMMFVGPSVMDVAQHFVERWNFTRDLKYRHSDRFPLLDWPHDDPLNDQLQRHPHTARFRQLGRRFNQETVHLDKRRKGDMKIQVCRSVGDWSCGWTTEQSIQNAYIQSIREANHFIYIENQFFVSIPGGTSAVKNGIAAAIVERVLSAAQAGERFKVMIVIPEVPCFSGDVKATSSISTIIDHQYRSLCRGKESMYGMIEAAGYEPRDYITIFNLRGYDRIKFDPMIWERMEQQSGLVWGDVLAAVARMNIGDNPPELEEKNNRTIRFKAMKYGDGLHEAVDTGKDKKGQEDIQTIPLPKDTAAAMEIINRWQTAAPPELRDIPSSIARNTLQSGRSTSDEPWYGTEEAEKEAFVSEEIYPHTKLMIVDDRKVICGSANINDRSQMGNRDSEIAVVIEDTELLESVMDGKKFMANRFAVTLRRRLFRQHLGLIRPQDVPGPLDPAMEAVGRPNEYDFGSREDQVVVDPLNQEFQDLWNSQARVNAEIYQRMFHCVPAKGIKDWNDYKQFVPSDKKIGHIHNQENLSAAYIKSELSKIRGHLTEMPSDFLENAGLTELSASVNPLTLPIYL